MSKLTISLQLGAMFFPVVEVDLAEVAARHGADEGQFMIDLSGQPKSLKVFSPRGFEVIRPQDVIPEHETNFFTGGKPALFVDSDSETLTVFLATGQSKSSDETLMGAPFNEQ